jgi:hypothetical protein
MRKSCWERGLQQTFLKSVLAVLVTDLAYHQALFYQLLSWKWYSIA